MFPNEYNQIIREYFDIKDKATRKCIVALEDAEQTQLLSALSSALYDKIVQKVDDIDFGTIPNSRGDITKVEGFDNTVECLNIMRNIVLEYKENPEIVDTVLVAIENVKNRKSTFMKAYALNVEFPMVLYNLIVMSIEQSVSFLISVCIQYIKDPSSQTVSAALDKVAYNSTKENLLYEQLSKFNKSCASGEIETVLDDVMKNAKLKETVELDNMDNNDCEVVRSPFQKFDDEECGEVQQRQVIHEPESSKCVQEGLGSVFDISTKLIGIGLPPQAKIALGIAGVAAGSMVALKAINFLMHIFIPLMRSVTYFLVNSVVKFSDCLSVQAQFIEANAYKLQYSSNSNIDDNKRSKIVQKQLKIADKLKSMSNKFAIDNKKAKKKAEEMAASENKKIKIEDLKDDISSDIYTKSVLF